MFIHQNLEDFISNPMGKGSNAIPSRQLIKDDLKRRLSSMLKEPSKKITLNIFKKKDDYYFHLVIPSETTARRNSYDVVLQFTPGENKEVVNDKNLNRYVVKFFSNSPSFTYTYAYAFDLYGMFVEDLAGKYDKQVFNNPPVTRNPGEVINYEKTIFFAAQYIMDNNKFLNKLIIDSLATAYNEKEFAKRIRNTDSVELESSKENRRLQKEKEAQREKDKKDEKSSRRGNTVPSKQRVVSKTKTTGVAKKSKITPQKSSITKIKPR